MAPNVDHNLVILHGSQTTGRATERSDWDVAVLHAEVLSAEARAGLRGYLAHALGVPEEKVDIADLRFASPLFRYRVASQGQLLAGDPRDFMVFRIRAWKDHLNNAKFVGLGDAALRKALT